MTWRMELPIVSRTPMPPRVLNSYVGMALYLGFFRDVPRAAAWIPAAVIMRAAFKSLLRPREGAKM